MNFLSHFYFESNNPDENMVMGVVLPDFVKNAQKESNLYPLKESHLFLADKHQLSILKGWERHVIVDNIFHSSAFFKLHTGTLKQLILPALDNSPVKPFFLAHIGLELILDHLLIIDGLININVFYDQINRTDKTALDNFLKNCGVNDTEVFFKFLNSFISSRYLLSYQKMENISYALNRICMRLWDNPFTPIQLEILTNQLNTFKDLISNNYLSIFNLIESDLESKDHKTAS